MLAKSSSILDSVWKQSVYFCCSCCCCCCCCWCGCRCISLCVRNGNRKVINQILCPFLLLTVKWPIVCITILKLAVLLTVLNLWALKEKRFHQCCTHVKYIHLLFIFRYFSDTVAGLWSSWWVLCKSLGVLARIDLSLEDAKNSLHLWTSSSFSQCNNNVKSNEGAKVKLP